MRDGWRNWRGLKGRRRSGGLADPDAAENTVEIGDLVFEAAELAETKGRLALDRHETEVAAGSIMERVEGDPDRIGFAVFAVVDEFDRGAALFADGAAEFGDGSGIGVGTLKQVAGFAAFHLGEGVAAEVGESGIYPDSISLLVGDDGGVGQLGGKRS
jgi:hypothetical protein